MATISGYCLMSDYFNKMVMQKFTVMDNGLSACFMAFVFLHETANSEMVTSAALR